MKYHIIKQITCLDSLICANNIRTKLETNSLILMARNESAIVNGSITILHENGNHIIDVEIYTLDEQPNNMHKSTFKTPKNLPTLKILEDKLG